eukprot:scaffold51383_cov67-Cyclotella_meneghiniana.AAC.2
MTKYWPPIECQYTQRQNKAPILPPSEAVLSATFVVHCQTAAGSTPVLTYFPVGRNLPILELTPSCQSKAISSRALAACWAPFTMRCHIYATGLHTAHYSEVLTRTELCVMKDSCMAMGNRSTKVWNGMLQEHVGLGNYELETRKIDGVRGWYLRLGPHATGDASFVHPNAQVGCTLPKIGQMPNVTKWRNELKGLQHHLTGDCERNKTPRKEQREPSSVTPARGTVTSNQITPDRSVTLIHQQEAAKNTYWDIFPFPPAHHPSRTPLVNRLLMNVIHQIHITNKRSSHQLACID